MVDVFISYSRGDVEKVGMLARMIASEGYQVWWDADLPPHMSYGDVITAKIGAAKAAVVVWSDTAAKSEWVRAEADVARNQKKLIQTSLDDVMPPLPFNQIQCAAIGDWNGEADHRGWSKVKESLIALCGPRGADAEGDVASPAPEELAGAVPNAVPAAKPAPQPRAEPPDPISQPAKSGMSTPLIIALGCGGVAVLGVLAVIALAFIGISMEDAELDDRIVIAESDDASALQSDAPADDSALGPDVVTDGDYIPQLEESVPPAPSVQPPPDMAAVPGNMGGQSGTQSFIIATVQDPDGYTNVRAGPSTNSAIIGRVEEGDIFTTYQQSETWWIVQLEDGTEGYIFNDRIFVIGPL